MPSLTQVAHAADVSRATASLVLNRSKGWERISSDCALRVKAVADRLGYRTNYHMQSIRRGRANVIGFVTNVGASPNSAWRLHQAFWRALSGGAEAASHERQFDVLTIRPDEHHSAMQRAVQAVAQRRIDAIIYPFLSASDIVAGVPIVAIGQDLSLPVAIVAIDDSAGVRLAITHLKELGHLNLIWFGPSRRGLDDSPDRREGQFIAGAWDMGMRGQSWLVAPFEPADHPDPEYAYLCHLERQADGYLQAQPRQFSAVVAYNDYYALGMCRALARHGIAVPRDVSVVGFDNLNAATSIPSLTTIDHRLHELGHRACQLAIEMAIDKESTAQVSQTKAVFTPTLVVRESTAPVGPSPKREGK